MLGEKKAEKDGRLSSSLPWIPGETRLEEKFQGDMSKPREVETRSRLHVLDPSGQSTGKKA